MKEITDKEEAIRRIEEAIKYKRRVSLEVFSKELRADKEVALLALQTSGMNLLYLSDELRDNEEVVLTAVKNHGWALKYASARLRDNEEVVLTAVKEDGCALMYASDELKHEEDVLYTAMKHHPGDDLVQDAICEFFKRNYEEKHKK